MQNNNPNHYLQEDTIDLKEVFKLFIDSKKVIQCIATRIPTPAIFNSSDVDFFDTFLLTISQIYIAPPPIRVLQKTKGVESIEMSFPKIPVNPKIRITKCISNIFFALESMLLRYPITFATCAR